jgi:hypothetical protein
LLTWLLTLRETLPGCPVVFTAGACQQSGSRILAILPIDRECTGLLRFC